MPLNARLCLASSWSTTCFPDDREGEVGDAVIDDSAGYQAQGLRVAGLGEEKNGVSPGLGCAGRYPAWTAAILVPIEVRVA